MGTAYRYWRINVPIFPQTPWVIAEAQMRVAKDGSGSNLSTTGGGTASASATLSAGTAANAFDGSTATTASFTTGSAASWLQWDFGAGVTQDIQHLTVYVTTNNTIPFSLEGSNDLTTWERRIYRVNGVTASTLVGIPANYPLTVVPKTMQPVTLGASRTIPTSVSLASDTLLTRDIWDGGFGTISGAVKVKQTGSNVPVSRRVVLIDEVSNRIIRQTWSRASDGYYEFKGVDLTRKFTALAFDYTHNYRAVLADNVAPT